MTPPLILAAVLSALYAAAFCNKDPSWPKSLIKTASVLLLAVVAVQGQGPWLLLLALLLCALGDYLLSRPGEGSFMAGVGAFAAGHIAYVALFVAQGLDPARLGQMPGLAVAAALALLGVVMAVLLWRKAGAMRGPVLVYIPIILSMGVAAAMLPPQGAVLLVLPAALLFILSDFLLALEMFVLPKGAGLARILPFIVWPTYWLAQTGFTLAFTFTGI
ncbi:MAG: lysoplasmalogenase [Paracoccaceae bacterium]